MELRGSPNRGLIAAVHRPWAVAHSMVPIDRPNGLVDRPLGMSPLTLRQQVRRRLCQPLWQRPPRRTSSPNAAVELMWPGRPQRHPRLHARLLLVRPWPFAFPLVRHPHGEGSPLQPLLPLDPRITREFSCFRSPLRPWLHESHKRGAEASKSPRRPLLACLEFPALRAPLSPQDCWEAARATMSDGPR